LNSINTVTILAVFLAGTILIGYGVTPLREQKVYSSSSSETNDEINPKSKITASGESTNNICSPSAINSDLSDSSCSDDDGITPTPSPETISLNFIECSGNFPLNTIVHCTVEDTGITDLDCFVADPEISGGDNVGDCTTNTGLHLECVIPPQPGVFQCNVLE
jgi:hypothetical protein